MSSGDTKDPDTGGGGGDNSTTTTTAAATTTTSINTSNNGTRQPKPRLLAIASDTTYISITSSASASSGVSGCSFTHSESSDATSQGIRSTYDMFVQQQGSSFARDIEALIRAEKESRATRRAAPREELKAGTPLCDKFLVLGAEQSRAPPLAMLTFRAGVDPSPEHSDPAIYHPKVLFRYPPSEGDNNNNSSSSSSSSSNDVDGIAGLTYFCFPEGAVPQKFVKKKDSKDKRGVRFSFKLLPTTSFSSSSSSSAAAVSPPPNQSALVLSREALSLNVDHIVGPDPEPFRFGTAARTSVRKHHASILVGMRSSSSSSGRTKKLISYHSDPENSFVFLISSSGSENMRYGVCVYKEKIVYQTDQFFCIEPLCYCLITSVPFLTFDVNALVSILDFPRVDEALSLPPEKAAAFVSEAERTVLGSPVHSKNTEKEPKKADTTVPPTPPPPPPPHVIPSTVINTSITADNVQNSNENNNSSEGKTEENKLSDDAPKTVAATTEQQQQATVPTVKDPEDSVTTAYKRVFRAVVEFMKLRVPEVKRPLKYCPETRKVPFEENRPVYEEESELLQEFGGSVLFHILPINTVLQLLCAVLLEYKVVVVSPNKRLLSTVVISLLPLLRPFTYPSSVIPVLPLSLLTYLEAPVPLLVGLTRQPHAESSEGFFIVNLHTSAVQCTKTLPPLPAQHKL